MRKRKLEMLLEQVKGFERPDVSREQYATPATVAAELLYFAFMNGDLDGSVATSAVAPACLPSAPACFSRMPASQCSKRRLALALRKRL